MENEVQETEKYYEFSNSEFNQIAYAANDVFMAMDKCHLRRANRERIDALQRKFTQVLIALGEKNKKIRKVKNQNGNGNENEKSDDTREQFRKGICVSCECKNGASIRVEIDAR